jgi:hypothetical protein
MENCLSSDYFLTTEAQSVKSDLVFARSGDGDRATELSAPSSHRSRRVNNPRSLLCVINARTQTEGVCSKELPPKAEALFPGRYLPAREKYLFSVASVSPWFKIFLLSTF